MQSDPQKTQPETSPHPRIHLTEEAAALLALLNEARALFHRLKIATEQVHHQGSMSAGKRGVLLSLLQQGPQTVPEIARARPVSRQHIQSLVNMLLDEGLVETMDNPAHKRSRLVSLTFLGKTATAAMMEREAKVLESVSLDLDKRDILSATRVMQEVRKYFESSQWSEQLEAVAIR